MTGSEVEHPPETPGKIRGRHLMARDDDDDTRPVWPHSCHGDHSSHGHASAGVVHDGDDDHKGSDVMQMGRDSSVASGSGVAGSAAVLIVVITSAVLSFLL